MPAENINDDKVLRRRTAAAPALVALRAGAGTPGGLRLQAYPSVTPPLVQLGIVEARLPRSGSAETRRFLTPLGQRAVVLHGRNEA